MTTAEYQRLYRAARESWPRLTREAMRGMQRIYDQAVEMVASVIRQAEQRGLAEITQTSWAQIETQLEEGARLIREALERHATRAITTGTERITGIDARYLIDASTVTGGKITATGVRNMYAAVNQTLISTLASRIYQGGYSFSERVWRVGYGYSAKIKDLVGSGLASSMDVRDIARVIESYVKKGARATTTRYGDLIGRAFRRRMGVDVSYPALRLVRSELYASMQQTALWAGRVNPGALDLYDWIRSTHEDWGCACPELAENSPYTYQNAPSYPHPNCLCRLVPRLMDRREFVDDLARWSRGEPVEYLDNWKASYYDQLS